MSVYEVETEDGSVYEVETEDNEPKQVASVGATKPSLAETVKGAFQKTLEAPMVNPVSSRLESAGQKVKSAVQESIGNIVEKTPYIPDTVKAGVGALASGATEMAPFTPTELATAIGGESLPIASPTAKKVSTTIANKFLNTPLRQLEKSGATQTATIGEDLLKYPELSGSRETVLNKVRFGIEKLENKIQSAISKSKEFISRKDIANSLNDMIEQESLTGIDDDVVNSLTQLRYRFASNPDELIPIQKANQIKRKLYRDIGDANYVKEKTTKDIAARKTIADSLKNAIEAKVPEVGGINQQYGDYLSIRDSLLKAMPKEAKKISSALFGDIEEAFGLGTARILANQGKATTKGIGGIATSLGDLIKTKQETVK